MKNFSCSIKRLFAALAIVASGTLMAEITDFGSIQDGSSSIQRPGAVVWMDLLTDDVESAASFYKDVFDWQFEFNTDRDYAYGTHNGTPVAAISAYDQDLGETEGLWLASVAVNDIETAVTRVKENGGAIIEPPENLPGRGRYVLVEDPTGAVVVLLRASSGDPERSEVNGRWLWTELWTDDVDKATDFYEEVVGYKTVAVKDTGGSVFQVMGRDQKPHVSVVKTPLPDVEPTWLPYLQVADIDATARAVLKAGGAVLVPPQKDSLNADVAIVADPTGGVFALQQKEDEK